MMGIFNYCMYDHKATDQTAEEEEEVQIDKGTLQVLQDVKDVFWEPMFFINKHSFFFTKDSNC